MDSRGDLGGDYELKRKLSRSILSGSDFKAYLIWRFGSFKAAATAAGYDESRIHQIAGGYFVPQGADLIKRLSEAWGIDLVILTQLFEKLRYGVEDVS